MNKEEIKNDFSVDYIKHINSNNTKYDIYDFGSLITILYGGSPFYLNGEQLEFTNDNKLSDSDVTEMLIDIYEHLSPDLKDGFLNETLTNSRTIPYDATEYFEKIKESKENEASVSEENENEKTDEETLENDVEENNIDYDTSDVELVEPETEVLEKEVEKEPETEISFDNGPAIKSYEEETLALEKEIEGLEIQEVELDEDSKNKLNKMEEELKEQEQILEIYKRKKQNLIDRNNLTNEPNKTYSLEIIKNAEYKINEQTKIVNDLKNQLMLAKKDLIEKNNNIRIDERIKNLEEKYKEIELETKKYYDNNKGIPLELHGRKNAIEDAINRLKNSASKDLISKKQELENEILEAELDEDSKNKLNKMEEELKEQEQILEIYKRKKQNLIDRNNLTNEPNKTYSLEIIKNAEYKINEQTKIVNDLKNQLMLAKKDLIEKNNNIRIDERIKNLEEKYKEIELETKKYYDNNKGIPLELHGRKNAIEDAINRLKNSVSIDLTSKKQELEEHKKNIKTYYECLEDIKNLYKDVQNGLDTNSEEFVNRVHDIDQKKVTLPEPLKNELSEFLMKIKGNEKKPIPIDKIEKNPKLTWKTFAFLAGGLALGATIGFAVGTTGLIIANAGLAVAKYFVNKKRKEAREKRLNGENEIVSVELPDNKLKAGIEKFKNYIKSEEGLRDISWGLTGGLIGLNVGHIAKNFVGTNNAPTETITQNTQTNNPTVNNTQTVDTNSYSDIRIGNNVGNHNVSVGHDSANWAVNNANPENLIGKYVNSDSVFQRFAVMNPDGTVGQIINTNGMSISDLQAMGIDPSSIAVDVGKNGVSQAWVNITELTKDVANIGRSIH